MQVDKMEIFFLIFGLALTSVQGQIYVIGKECSLPVVCLDQKSFTFCHVVNGQAILDSIIYTCPLNQVCVGQLSSPCIEVAPQPPVPTQPPPPPLTTTTPKPAPVTPPAVCSGPGIYPAPQCNQYYECVQSAFWYILKLQTCPSGQAFDSTKLVCVPSHQTSCCLCQ